MSTSSLKRCEETSCGLTKDACTSGFFSMVVSRHPRYERRAPRIAELGKIASKLPGSVARVLMVRLSSAAQIIGASVTISVFFQAPVVLAIMKPAPFMRSRYLFSFAKRLYLRQNQSSLRRSPELTPNACQTTRVPS